MEKLIVISMSGGLDSSTLCGRALAEGYTVLPVNFQYGQKNFIESVAQENVINHFKMVYGEDRILNSVNIDLTTAIKDSISSWQKSRDNGQLEAKTELGYYMPSRNLVFMAIAAVVGEIVALDKDIKSIALGLGIHKHSDVYARDYWDISPEFAYRLQNLLELNDVVEVELYAPYANKFKKDIVLDSIVYNVPYDLTWTCYNPLHVGGNCTAVSYTPCGECEACLERAKQAEGTSLEGKINSYCLTITPDTGFNC